MLDPGGDSSRAATAVRPPAPTPPAPTVSRPTASALTVSVRRPWPTVLVVRPCGVLDESSVAAVDAHVVTPPGEVLHVVLDLRDAAPLTPSGVRALLELDRRATRRGTALHLAGVAQHALLQRLVEASVLRGAPWSDELLGG